MKTERDLQDDEPRMVEGYKGVKSKHFVKKLANARAMERWLEANAGDCEIVAIYRA
jgi:hypothetical protein